MNHSFETDKIISVFNELVQYQLKRSMEQPVLPPVLVINVKTVFTINGSTEYVQYDVYDNGRFVEYELALESLNNLLETEKLLSDEREIIGGEI